MRNLDIADTRAKLELYAAQGQFGGRQAQLFGDLTPGGARAISAPQEECLLEDDEMLDRAAMEFGSD